ncbi:hypothetical protein KUA24_118 [Vibrio phage HNL01]|nr:hypothetical protein KUA24_118 [Vibrio phage HNL01]
MAFIVIVSILNLVLAYLNRESWVGYFNILFAGIGATVGLARLFGLV